MKYPPEDRLKGMHTMAAEELGHPWVCPVWDMEYETGNGCTPKK